jgi:hypothetical protein
VETKLAKFAVETRFAKLAVETKLRRFAVETTPVILETYPAVPNPITVDARSFAEIPLGAFIVTPPTPVGGEMVILLPANICVTPEFPMLTKPTPVAGGPSTMPAKATIFVTATLDKPTTVDANCVSRKVVETRFARLAVETTPVILET